MKTNVLDKIFLYSLFFSLAGLSIVACQKKQQTERAEKPANIIDKGSSIPNGRKTLSSMK